MGGPETREMQVLLTRTKAASPGLPELLGSSERKVGSIRFCPHLCQLPVRVGGCHQPPETSPRVRGRGSGSLTGSAAGQCCGHTCGLVLFCGRSPAFSLVVTRVWRPLMGRLCQRVSDPGPHSRPRLLPPRRQCVASGAASSLAPCPVASGGPAASPALSSGSGRKAARGGDGGAGITPHKARAGARPCRGRVKGRFAGYVPKAVGTAGSVHSRARRAAVSGGVRAGPAGPGWAGPGRTCVPWWQQRTLCPGGRTAVLRDGTRTLLSDEVPRGRSPGDARADPLTSGGPVLGPGPWAGPGAWAPQGVGPGTPGSRRPWGRGRRQRAGALPAWRF